MGADKLEREVERHVQTLLESPEKLRAHIDATIAAESSRNPDQDAAAWLRMVEDCDRKRAAYQDQQAAGLMTMDELGAKLTQLDERRATAQRELDKFNEGRRRVDELEATKRTLLRAYADGILYDGIRHFPKEMRRGIYEAMRLRITVPAEGKPRITGSVDQNVVRMSREAEEWAADVSKHKISSNRTDKVMAEVAT